MRKLADLKPGETNITFGLHHGCTVLKNLADQLWLKGPDGEEIRVTYDEARRYGLKKTSRIGKTQTTEVLA